MYTSNYVHAVRRLKHAVGGRRFSLMPRGSVGPIGAGGGGGGEEGKVGGGAVPQSTMVPPYWICVCYIDSVVGNTIQADWGPSCHNVFGSFVAVDFSASGFTLIHAKYNGPWVTPCSVI